MIATWIVCILLAQSPTHALDQVPTTPAASIADQSAQTPAATPPAAPPAPSGRWKDDRPITHLFQNLGKDLRALAAPEAGGVLLVGGGAAAVLHKQDQAVASWSERQPPASFANFGNVIGDGWTQSGGGIAIWAIGLARHSNEVAHIGSDLIRAQALNGLLTTSIKYAVNRDRPDGGKRSFPSGHTSATFASAAVLQSHFGWVAGAAGYAVGSVVGWARIRSDKHWLSDVVFGATIGLISGRSVARTHVSKWTVAPVKTTGGMAIVVTRR